MKHRSIRRTIYETILRKREYEVKFKWIDKKTFGEINYVEEKIFINIYLFLIDVYIHEITHERFIDLSEIKVKKKTDRAIKRMSQKQIVRLGRQLLRKLKL